jgi:ribonuclease HI
MPDKEAWVGYVDGSSMKSRSGAGVALITPDKEEIAVAFKLDFPTTNNEAEYETVIAGLSLAEHLGAKNLEIQSDSQVVVGHIQGGSEAKGEKNDKIPRQGFEFLGPFRTSGCHANPENRK